MTDLALRMDEGFEMILKALMDHTDEVLDIVGLCQMTGLSRSAVYQKTCSMGGRAPELPHFRKGKRLYFLRSEIKKWLTTKKIHTTDEIISASANLQPNRKPPYRQTRWPSGRYGSTD